MIYILLLHDLFDKLRNHFLQQLLSLNVPFFCYNRFLFECKYETTCSDLLEQSWRGKGVYRVVLYRKVLIKNQQLMFIIKNY